MNEVHDATGAAPMTDQPKVVPISPIMPIGRPAAPPRHAGANTPVTLGQLYLIYSATGRHDDLAAATLCRILEIDAAASA